MDISGVKVMIVDDSATIIRAGKDFLAQHNCQILAASNGLEAIAAIDDFGPDILLIDVEMPRLDGYRTCALIRGSQRFARLPIVFMSSRNNIFDVARGMMSGAEDYLVKPFNSEALVETIYRNVRLNPRAPGASA